MDIVIVHWQGGIADCLAEMLRRSLTDCSVEITSEIPNLDRDSILVVPAERLQTTDQATEVASSTDGEIIILEFTGSDVPDGVREVLNRRTPVPDYINSISWSEDDLVGVIFDAVAEIRR
jgi:hypothetical protein